MATLEQLYGHLKTLNKQWFYEKSEIDELLSDVVRDTDIKDVIRTSQTSGLVKNDGTIDTTVYATDSDLDDLSKDVTNNYIAKSQTSGLVKNDGTIDTTTYLSEHQDISGKANIADLHTVATSGSYTDLENIPSTFAPTAHEHNASEVKDSNAYSNLNTTANATQSAINYAIDSKIGALLSVEYQTIVPSLPTASADTMNKFYLVAESTSKPNDEYEIFITVKDGNDYDWEKVDTARIDLTGYSEIDHVHGNLTNDGKIGTNANYFVYTTTGGAVTSKATIGNITTDGTIGTDNGKVLVTGTNGVITTSDTVTEMDSTIQALIAYGSNLNS
jgi:hypothetical protein